MYASKITIIFFLGNTNHSILFLCNLVIVYANRTSNAVIFKRLSKGLQIYTSLLIDFCNDYRPHLCWQVSCILFAKIISSSDFNLSSKKNLSFLEVKKKMTSHHASGFCFTRLDSTSLLKNLIYTVSWNWFVHPWSVKYLAVYIYLFPRSYM